MSKALEIKMNLREKIEKMFSPKIFEHGLFYLFEGSLRFELSVGGDAIEMFTVSYSKALEILSDVFVDETKITVCLSFYGKKRYAASLSMFREVLDLGFKIPKKRELWCAVDEEDEEYYRHFMLFEIDIKYLRNLLWGAMAQELGVRPRIIGKVYLYGERSGVLAQPYDDRGMDLVPQKGKSLGLTFRKYNHYLLDYDREKMNRVYKNF